MSEERLAVPMSGSEGEEMNGMGAAAVSPTTGARCGAPERLTADLEGMYKRERFSLPSDNGPEGPPERGSAPMRWSDIDRAQWDRKQDQERRREAEEAIRRCSNEAQIGSQLERMMEESEGANRDLADKPMRRSFITGSDPSLQNWRATNDREPGDLELPQGRGRGRGRIREANRPVEKEEVKCQEAQ